MYAIVEIAGKQYRVNEKDKLKIPHLKSDPGAKVNFDRVLLYQDEKGNVSVGTPVIKDLAVSATVVEHGRDKKIIVFKKKRRKGYRRFKGHRQDFSVIEIETIGKIKQTAALKTGKAEPVAKEESKVKTPAKKTKAAAPKIKKDTAAKKETAKPGTTAKTTKAKTSVKSAKQKEDKKEA